MARLAVAHERHIAEYYCPCFPGVLYYRPITGPGQPRLSFAIARGSSGSKVRDLMAQSGAVAMVKAIAFVLWDFAACHDLNNKTQGIGEIPSSHFQESSLKSRVGIKKSND